MYIYICIDVHIYTYMYMYMYTYVYIYIYVNICICICFCIVALLFLFIYLFVRLFVNMSMYVIFLLKVVLLNHLVVPEGQLLITIFLFLLAVSCSDGSPKFRQTRNCSCFKPVDVLIALGGVWCIYGAFIVLQNLLQ